MKRSSVDSRACTDLVLFYARICAEETRSSSLISVWHLESDETAGFKMTKNI